MSKVAEKKLINEKIAKVREVVHGVSTNDIILALHSFDMNVERTIQAFCEDGASEVLDDWVRPTSGSSKNKNKKKKNKPAASEPASGAVTSSTPSPSKVTKAPPAQETKPAVVSPTPQPDSKPSPQTNGFVVQTKREFPFALRAAVTGREKTLLAACGANSKFVDAEFNHLISLIEKFGSDCLFSVVETSPRGASGAASTVSTGLPKAVSPVQAAAIKHATSQSSISSSLGADSGVNLSPTHKDEKNPAPTSKPAPVAKIVSGGIQMQSDVLSPDQLEALQRKLAEQLAACGIDASVLSGVTGGDMPVRRPRKQDGPKRGGQMKPEKTAIHPQLSIL
ncbi:hypothetical protein ANCCEY_07417 [Ancylostoma ceylanicum]|uniref:CUE domain-containing protein n=1 Tax=Ancylostoma ceylanicum TaxID=53326 RepID=A0A0D6LQH8_9BILA|nr:hypothetical protein ANCCEY_07417 [Ancylostoma ceylanicum]